MAFLRRLPACLSLLLLGAHFLRFGHLMLVLCCLLLLVPVFLTRRWARLAVQASLGLGSLIWAWTLAQDVQQRWSFGEPWTRLACILGAVAVFTAWSAWLVRPRTSQA